MSTQEPLPSNAEVELEFYEKFFIERGLEPYPVQEQAAAHIFAGRSVMITVPTGTGKTLMAKAGILRALRAGKTAIYTTPLRALTEEKYRELCDDFGAENVGFATGDYKVNPDAPIQVLVAEILWNRIYGDRMNVPADIVIMDEGHYFNDFERGYVWEQSIIGLHPRTQLIILSATVGYPQEFCQWVYVTRRIPLELVQSTERKVPLLHEMREEYLIDTVKQLFSNGEYPAIIFTFGRELCFERARLLRSCPRFTTDEEKAKIEAAAKDVLLDRGLGPDLMKILTHGIGIHHAGILPAYRRLVEQLTLERLLKFVVTTETISAGINLPAKRVIFPSLRKFIRGKARILLPAEYHQMSGRAGRPQFDTEGIAITLAPEEMVQEYRKEIKDLKKGGFHKIDEAQILKKHYARVKAEARAKKDVSWDPETHKALVAGQAAALKSRTQVTAEQILAIGLPDLATEVLPGAAIVDEKAKPAEEDQKLPPQVAEKPNDAAMPAHENLNIRTVIDNLLLGDAEKREAHKRLAQITRNLQALGVLDEHGVQVKGEIIGKIRGVDGVFVWYALNQRELTFEEMRELVEWLVDHDVIQKIFDKKEYEKVREWVLARLREMRRDNPQLTFEDVEPQYWEAHPRELGVIELLHQAFAGVVPHPELHGGKSQKKIWAQIDDEQLTFLDYVEKHGLDHEEGSLFTYLARVMNTARMLFEVTEIENFNIIQTRVREKLGVIDPRVLETLW